MQFIRLGRISSEDELQAAPRSVRGGGKLQLAEVLTSMVDAEKNGFATERAKWDAVVNKKIVRVRRTWRNLSSAASVGDGVFVFSGGVPRPGEDAIWAAIDVAPSGRTLTLVKLVASFGGGTREEQGLLKDALDRVQRGKRHEAGKR